jgi:hypothetical protein
MKRELIRREGTEMRGVVVELYKCCSGEKATAAAPPIRSQLPGSTRASMMWLHFPFFGYLMTRRSLDLVGETSSLDPNDPKPMTKRGQITTKNTLTNPRADPVLPLEQETGKRM